MKEIINRTKIRLLSHLNKKINSTSRLLNSWNLKNKLFVHICKDIMRYTRILEIYPWKKGVWHWKRDKDIKYWLKGCVWWGCKESILKYYTVPFKRVPAASKHLFPDYVPKRYKSMRTVPKEKKNFLFENSQIL